MKSRLNFKPSIPMENKVLAVKDSKLGKGRLQPRQ